MILVSRACLFIQNMHVLSIQRILYINCKKGLFGAAANLCAWYCCYCRRRRRHRRCQCFCLVLFCFVYHVHMSRMTTLFYFWVYMLLPLANTTATHAKWTSFTCVNFSIFVKLVQWTSMLAHAHTHTKTHPRHLYVNGTCGCGMIYLNQVTNELRPTINW